MKKRAAAIIFIAAVAATASGSAEAFPLGFSGGGGVGVGYYAMNTLNDHIGVVAQEYGLTIDDLASGVNFRVEGRLWYERYAALTGGYEHFWGETEPAESASILMYRAPANVYTLGILVAFMQLENSLDLCVGVNRCWCDAVFGTNEFTGRRLAEWKGEDAGFEAYAEIHTNFLNPIEVGLQLGYRGLKINGLYDIYGELGYLEPGVPIIIDYSGAFFYLTSSIRIN